MSRGKCTPYQHVVEHPNLNRSQTVHALFQNLGVRSHAYSKLTSRLTFIRYILDGTRCPMGTNEVTESLHHNDNLFHLRLERKTMNDTGCNIFGKIFQFCMHNFCVAISDHGRECRSSERPKFALVQPIIFSKFDDACILKDSKMALLRLLRWPITYRLVAHSCWSCGLQASTRKAVLKKKYRP